MSSFIGSVYPKAVAMELAHRTAEATFRGQKFQVSVFTGASTGPELDGVLSMAGGTHLRLPYQSDPDTRKRINAGEMEVHGHSSEPCGPVRGIWIPGQDGRGTNRRNGSRSKTAQFEKAVRIRASASAVRVGARGGRL